MVKLGGRSFESIEATVVVITAALLVATSGCLTGGNGTPLADADVDGAAAPVLSDADIAVDDAAPFDVGRRDGTSSDAASDDARPSDAVPLDAVPPDAVPPDAVPPDAVPPDAVPPDAVPPDVRLPDARWPDARWPDARLSDVLTNDAAWPPVPLDDAAPPDVAPDDALPPDANPYDAAPVDAARLDAAAPDVAAPDVAAPDVAAPDVTPPDAGPGTCPPGEACAYRWSANTALAPAVDGRQRCETALTTGADGRVWLSYLDTDYHEIRPDFSVAWPRDVVVWTSADQGATFGDRRVLSAIPDRDESEGDESLASDALGNVYAAWVQYDHEPDLVQKIYVQRVAGPDGAAPPVLALPWEPGMAHDQSSVHVGADGILHVIGRDIARYDPGQAPNRTLYARSRDEGQTFENQQRLPDLGGNLPQLVSTQSGLMIAGPTAYMVSNDNGVTFGPRLGRMFVAAPPGANGKLVRLATDPARRVAYAVGDSTNQGIRAHATEDGGTSWRSVRVDDGVPASAWRYPAVHVDANGRVHVIWMDDRTGAGAVYHAYSDDDGRSFSADTRLSDADFPFSVAAPPPPPATQDGSWIGDYHSITTAAGRVIVAWADQRAGNPRTTVYVAVGRFEPVE